MRVRVATDDVDLLDLLDRILDKGLFVGSASLLVLGQTNLSESNSRISVASMQTNTDTYARPAKASLALIRRTLR